LQPRIQRAAVIRGEQSYRLDDDVQRSYALEADPQARVVSDILTSMAKTLATKLRISVPQVYRRFGTVVPINQGSQKVLRVTVECSEDAAE
jgi:chemotaxis protein CheY-P-specific phosphatase CheC